MGDADRDGAVAFSDITAVLANFGAACGSGSEEEGGGEDLMAGGPAPGAGLSDALAQMGFESLNDFIEHIAGLPDDDARLAVLGELISRMSRGGEQ